MFYKKDNNGNWFVGKVVYLPSGKVLNEENKEDSEDWKWYEQSPEDYLTWKKEQDDKLSSIKA